MPIFGRMIKHCNAIKKALIIIVMWIDEGLHGLERIRKLYEFAASDRIETCHFYEEFFDAIIDPTAPAILRLI
jgi:hypothetical protein